MIVFPNCKINLGLSIGEKRTDGYHNLETIFYPLTLQDALEIIHSEKSSGDIQLTKSGLPVEGKEEDNICIKAYRLLKKDFPELPSVSMHLHKVIPTGAGLGGGSADGAFCLQLLNKKFNLGINEYQLMRYALQLGSDCPFFIFNKPAYAKGRGELLEELNLDLSSYKIAIINPGINVSTAWAFSQLNSKRIPVSSSLKDVVNKPVKEWKQKMINDFEGPVFDRYPEIGHIKTILNEQGALFSGMSGSGSTVYGIFDQDISLAGLLPDKYFVKII